MTLLTETTTFGLEKRHLISPEGCHLHCFCTFGEHNGIKANFEFHTHTRALTRGKFCDKLFPAKLHFLISILVRPETANSPDLELLGAMCSKA